MLRSGRSARSARSGRSAKLWHKTEHVEGKCDGRKHCSGGERFITLLIRRTLIRRTPSRQITDSAESQKRVFVQNMRVPVGYQDSMAIVTLLAPLIGIVVATFFRTTVVQYYLFLCLLILFGLGVRQFQLIVAGLLFFGPVSCYTDPKIYM